MIKKSLFFVSFLGILPLASFMNVSPVFLPDDRNPKEIAEENVQAYVQKNLAKMPFTSSIILAIFSG